MVLRELGSFPDLRKSSITVHAVIMYMYWTVCLPWINTRAEEKALWE